MRDVTVLDVAQRSRDWFTARCGRLTGSGAAAILATRGRGIGRETLRARLVAERRTGGSLDGDGFESSDMRRGVELEPAAVAAYEVKTGHLVRPSGFLSHNALMVGCSLDGHVGVAFDGILEIKCGKSTTHWKALHEGRAGLARYFPQIRHNLWVSGAAWCDLVRFDDRFPDPYHLVIVRVHCEEVDIAGYERAALAFLDEVEREFVELMNPAPRRSFVEQLRASLEARAAIGAV